MDPLPDDSGLSIRRVPLEALHLDPANARAHDERNLAAITDSLKRFGQAEPLVVQASTGCVIGGNGRLAAMRALGWTECDIVELDLESIDAAALGIALNRTAELAEWSEPALARILDELRAEDALEGVGFDGSEIDALLAELELAGMDELEDAGPDTLPEVPVSRQGDLWLLGRHRLLCGDSTCAEDLARLMNGERAHLLATDPPYLVNYQGSNHPQGWGNGHETTEEHWDDFTDADTGIEFFRSYLAACLAHCVERVPTYQWHASRRQDLVEQAWSANGLLVHQTLIWVKARAVLTRCHYSWQHEPAYYGWPKGRMPEKDRRPPNNATTIWEIDQQGEQDGIHPTQKPLEIFRRPITSHTRPGEIVLEPFSGSGTQLIAAEELGRRCYAIELSPAYVDVAVERWQRATSRAATLQDDGRTFEELAQIRKAP